MEVDDFGAQADPYVHAATTSSREQTDASYQPSSRSGVPASRSASVAVYSSSPSAGTSLSPAPQSTSSSTAPRKRASHSVAPSNGSMVPPPGGSRSQFTDVYSLPAAVAYAAAHPRRQIPKFGPYLLLQTLGEGEFGKVKLGLHQEYGEEVAVKLIRRGSVDNAVRFSKIEREIEVLKNIRHPNIVRLYDVIETDKYIGIILEYASGGELFDHILAHRYLRERDAAKLFAQLVSGVSYIHAKKIVHRDLKLENLLLDRNRNVIITDFGFANRFEHKADDLMQTSCGSPCYAAPELVISEGLYVGSAVDIWSCGVILYAMLAGYLPFDDDPANPDGDNINLLYKYIINTQLTFPEYVSAEARDLLNKMLVPDPAKRCDLDGVKRHPWLKAYASLFEKSVDELEQQAMEMQNAKRMQYQKMMRSREREAALQAQQQQTKMSRTQSARMDGSGGGGLPMAASSSASTRTKNGQHQQEFLYETGGSDLVLPTTGRRAVASAIIPTSHSSAMDDDPFGGAPATASSDRTPIVLPSSASTNTPSRQHGKHPYDDSSRSRKSSVGSKAPSKAPSSAVNPTSPPVSSPSGGKKKGGYRHTIQLEWDDGNDASPPLLQQPPPPALPVQSNGFHEDEKAVANTIPVIPPFQRGDSIATANSYITSVTSIDEPKGMTTSPTSAAFPPESAMEVVEAPDSIAPNAEPLETEETKEQQREAESEVVESMSLDGVGQETPRKQSIPKPPSRENSNVTPKGRKTPMSITTAPGQQPASPIATPKGSVRSHMSPIAAPPSPTLKRNATEPKVPVTANLQMYEDESMDTPPTTQPVFGQLPESPKVSVHTQEDKSPKAIVGPAERLLTPSASSAASVSHSVSTSSNKSGGRHRKGMSLDKFGLGKLLGSNGSDQNGEKPADRSKPPVSATKSNLGPPISFDPSRVVGPGSPGTAGSETASVKSKSSRKKRLTLMMAEPFGTAKAAVRDRSKSHRSVTGPVVPPPTTPSQPITPVEKSPGTTGASSSEERAPAPEPVSIHEKSTLPSTPAHDSSNDMLGMNGGSTGKAKKVMDWFRKRSLAKNSGASTADALFAVVPPTPLPHRSTTTAPASEGWQHTDEPLTPTADTYRSNGPSMASLNGAPQVVVTAAAGSQQPSNWGASPRSASGTSHNSTDTTTSTHPTVPTSHATDKSGSLSQRNESTAATATAKAFNKAMLRVHHGAVDQGTITTGFPPETMRHVTEVLLSMGIEVQRESEFKYRCIRHKKKKERSAMAGLGIKDGSGAAGVVPVTVTGAAASNGVDRRGLPIPSASSAFGATGGMLRGLLLRRGSHAPSPHSLESSDEHGALSPIESSDREPVYGDRTVDQHDEVRFSVELTRLDRLEDTFSLDVRRLKGNLRSYKFLYDLIRERATPAN
ncbi:hypothetical protein FRB95_010787 [Tulasnella sp. JGI-2019a]|nr:hypothetical protein FRB95_010787 [Tulasnella sp. JGI-2019a]